MRYNLNGFNLAAGSRYRYVDRILTVTESINSLAGKARILSRNIRQNERLVNTLQFTLILARGIEVFEKISFKAELLSIMLRKILAGESILADIQIGKNMYLPLLQNEKIAGGIHIGKSAYTEVDIAEQLNASAHIGKLMWHDRDMYEIVNSFLRMALRRYQVFYLDAEMPPGSELRIDSNNFTAFLNHMGQTKNIRAQFNGDWIHFDRNTRRLYVENEGVDLLKGDVVYNDRWL